MLIQYNQIIAYHNNFLYTIRGIIDINTTPVSIDSSPIGIGMGFRNWCGNWGLNIFYLQK